MSQQYAVEEEAAIVAWACQQCSRELETFGSTHIEIRLIGVGEDGETHELAFKVELTRARELVQLSGRFQSGELETAVAALTPEFATAPAILIATCDKDEEII